jgi:hypothetical protein
MNNYNRFADIRHSEQLETMKKIEGYTILSINGLEKGSDSVSIITTNGTLTMYHLADCCEVVSLNDFEGDVSNLIGKVIVSAEVVINPEVEDSSYEKIAENDPDIYDSGTWTFYRFATIKGYVNIRWYGSSNGYYSEGVGLAVYKEA